jgi:hypothetical protein
MGLVTGLNGPEGWSLYYATNNSELQHWSEAQGYRIPLDKDTGNTVGISVSTLAGHLSLT